MNIYFACSITGGRQYEVVYQAIVEALIANGHGFSMVGQCAAQVCEENHL